MVNAPTITFDGIRERLRKRADENRFIWSKKRCPNMKGKSLFAKCTNEEIDEETGKKKCGREFHRPVWCGRESCPVCGEEYSQAHRRRFHRWFYWGLFLFEKFGYRMRYIVITLPFEVCLAFTMLPPWKVIKLLKEFSSFVRDWLKRELGGRKIRYKGKIYEKRMCERRKRYRKRVWCVYDKEKKMWVKVKDENLIKRLEKKLKKTKKEYVVGKMRYHWAGNTGYFFPHLNILIIGAWIDIEFIEKLRSDCAEWWKGKGFKVPDSIVVNTRYVKTQPKLIHKVKYITRPTLNLINDTKFEEFVSNYLERVAKVYKNLYKKILTFWQEKKYFDCAKLVLVGLLRDKIEDQLRLLFNRPTWELVVNNFGKNDIDFGWTRELKKQYRAWLWKRKVDLEVLLGQELEILDNCDCADLPSWEIERLNKELRRVRLMLGLCPFCGARLTKWKYDKDTDLGVLEAQGWYFDSDLGILYKDTS